MSLREFLFGRMRDAADAAPARRRAPRPGAARSFLAAQNDRLTADLERYAANRSAIADLRYTLRTMRDRSRHVTQNNGYAAKYLKLAANNIVGPSGFTLQMRVANRNAQDGFDEPAGKRIEEAWQRWSEFGVCTADGMLSRADAERLIVRQVVRDGEVLVRLLRAYRGNAARFALQLIEADHLDDELNVPLGDARTPLPYRLPEGHEIRMGVERDVGGRPQAYWLRVGHPGDEYRFRNATHQRVPASEMLHVFYPERIGASRGVPWFYSGLRRLWMLGQYEEAELTAARFGASKMAFYTRQLDADAAPLADSDEAGQPMQDIEPGVIETLPPGYDLKAFDPTHPVDAFGPFVKYQLRGFAAGLGLPYETLVADLEAANYSALRHGELSARDEWRTMHDWVRGALLRPVFGAWLEMALLSREVALDPLQLDRYVAGARFMGRGWQWVDPAKEIAADRDAVGLGVKTRAQICAERGLDFDDVVRGLAREQELAASLGVSITSSPASSPAPPPAPPASDDETTDEASDDRSRNQGRARRQARR